ncbi:MAG: hypothetical protein MJ154_02175 [Candidatus Saccharibacteria bacterium]|nr:hypothetical protein [Candidatus Saccharibacteria bacterium]
MKKASLLIAIVLVAAAVNPVSAKTLSEEQMGLISSNCSSIKLQLKRIQKDDARNRVHLGAQYESIATNLMMNLNLRLVKNGMASAELAEQQTTFMSERDRFKDDYIGYSQELETLISVDCKNEPQKFYNQLNTVRKKRKDVDSSMKRLSNIVKEHRQSLESLKEGLKK